MEGVSVALKPGGITKVTGADGSYTFGELEAKEYTLTYTKGEYRSLSKETTVQAGVNNVVDVMLEREPIVPVLQVSAHSLDFGSELTTLSLDIRNAGKGALNWTIKHEPGWFQCSPMMGTTATEPSSVTVTVSRTQKEKGSYSGSFSITSNGGSQDVTVNMTVSGVNLTIEPVELNFGTLATEQQLTLTNQGTLPIDYTVERFNSWIVPEKLSAKFTSTDYLKVMVNRASLSPGNHTGSLTINVKGELFVVPVRMSIAANDKPVVSISQPTNITANSATFSGVIESIGKDRVTQYGFCWDTSPNPTLSNSSSRSGDTSVPKTFENVASGLESSTTYYVRAYAQNSVGISYSSELAFTTADPLTVSTIPTVSTGDMSELSTSAAKVSGTVFSLGHAAGVTQHGHVWSTSPKPPASLSTRTALGSLTQIASYTSTLSNLSPSTTYYVRAYATNSMGTAYGADLTFQTPATTPSTVPVTGVSLSQTSLSKQVSDPAVTLVATVSPANATNKNVTWSTSNMSVATVVNGVVNFLWEGTATITATTVDGNKTATCVVTVTPATVPVTSVSLSQTSLSGQVGSTATLTATVLPSYATNKTVSWSTNNSSVATVSSGVVTFVGAGNATITVTTADGGKTASCAVTVTSATVPVTGVSLNQTSLTGYVGASAVTLTATVSPSNASNKNVSWSTSNSSVATVSNGVVNFVGVGSATISATTQNGEKTASCIVTVTIGGRTGTLTWSLVDGTLTISGTGAMRDYGYPNIPWYNFSTDIRTVNIQDGVTSIGNQAFPRCSSITSITIPNSVTSIGSQSFQDCSSLASITIPNSVTSIGYAAFYDCSSLTSITIPNSVTTIGYSVFSGCSSLTSITIPNSWTSIGSQTFSRCSSLTSITIPNSVTSIGNAAFSDCSSLTSITIPNSVTSIGELAFANCSSLTSITIPNSVTSIGGRVFEGCSSLTSITIPNLVTSIGQRSFYGCSSLTSITIPNSVTSIGNYAFVDCNSLISITIPNSVASIGAYAFWGCSSLRNVVVLQTTPLSIDSSTFYNVPLNLATLTVPKGSKSAYQNAVVWKNFGTIVELD